MTISYDKLRPTENKGDESTRTLGYFISNLTRFLNDKPTSIAILEIGPGTGLLANWLRKLGFSNYTCVEACRNYAETMTKLGFKCINQNDMVALETGELKGKSFDLIFMIDVLEHFDRDKVIPSLHALSRLLSKNGEIIIQIPNASGLFGMNTQVSDFTHRSAFNETTIKSVLKASGLITTSLKPVRLPKSIPNWFREKLRGFIFFGTQIIMRIVGSSPIKVLSHLMIISAKRDEYVDKSSFTYHTRFSGIE